PCGLPGVDLYGACRAPSGLVLWGWTGPNFLPSGKSISNVTDSPDLKPVPISVNAAPTGPLAGRTTMLATGLGSVVATAVVVVVFLPPPDPQAAQNAASRQATKTRRAISWRAARGRRGRPRDGAASTWPGPRSGGP